MEWTAIATPALAFLGVLVAEFVKLKSKKLDVSSMQNKAIADCKDSHQSYLNKVKDDFVDRLSEIDSKLDAVQAEQLRLSLTVTQLQRDVAKHNGVIERTYALEKSVAVLDNREKVSEKRLLDLEKAQ